MNFSLLCADTGSGVEVVGGLVEEPGARAPLVDHQPSKVAPTGTSIRLFPRHGKRSTQPQCVCRASSRRGTPRR
jgi:hypothetical protein